MKEYTNANMLHLNNHITYDDQQTKSVIQNDQDNMSKDSMESRDDDGS